MAFRQNHGFLVISLLLIGGVVAGALWISRVPPETRIREAALANLHSREGKTESVGDITVRALLDNTAIVTAVVGAGTPRAREVHLEIIRNEGVWIFSRNFLEDFNRFWKTGDHQNGFFIRLHERLSKSLDAELDIPAGDKYSYQTSIKVDGEKVFGTIMLRFRYGSPGGPKEQSAAYSESHRFDLKTGRWVLEGGGRLMLQPRRPRQ